MLTGKQDGIWGSSPTNIWAVGDRTAILRYTGTSWQRGPSGTSEILYGIWGSGPGDMWAAGNLGRLVHYDGTSWKPANSGTNCSGPGGSARANLVNRVGAGAGGLQLEMSEGVQQDLADPGSRYGALRSVFLGALDTAMD